MWTVNLWGPDIYQFYGNASPAFFLLKLYQLFMYLALFIHNILYVHSLQILTSPHLCESSDIIKCKKRMVKMNITQSYPKKKQIQPQKVGE